MMTDQHRRMVLDRLAAIEAEVASIATWLVQLDEDRAAAALEAAWQAVAATCWELERRGLTRQRPGVP